MNTIKQAFQEADFYPALDVRGPTFAHMIDHLEQHTHLNHLIETGTARIQGNWGGDGQSTLIWDWLADRLPISVTSIDICETGVNIAKSQVKNIKFIVGDSIEALASYPPENLSRVGLLYLDSYDWSPETNMESAFHHMAELATVWAHLPSGCMIAVDDCHSQFKGKHIMVYMFMNKMGIKPHFVGYQVGWIKP